MYNAITNVSSYGGSSICNTNYSLECVHTPATRKRMSAQKRAQIEVWLISLLLIVGNIVVLKKVSPSFDNFLGYFLKAATGISLGVFVLKAFTRKFVRATKKSA